MHSHIDHGQSAETTVRINDFLTSGGIVKTERSQNGFFTYYHDQKTQEIVVPYVKSHTPGYGTEAMRRISELLAAKAAELPILSSYLHNC